MVLVQVIKLANYSIEEGFINIIARSGDSIEFKKKSERGIYFLKKREILRLKVDKFISSEPSELKHVNSVREPEKTLKFNNFFCSL